MGTAILNQIKKNLKKAKLALTDVTPTESMAEEATNNDPWGPDAKTMTIIAEESFEVEDYWRVVDVLHERFENIDWKRWRQLYKSLVLLEFLLLHGPEEFAIEFQSDIDVIKKLAKFQHIGDKGFDWGACMQKRSSNVLFLLKGGEGLKMARLKALKITKEIEGFGSFDSSPSSYASSSTPSSSRTTTSFSTFSPSGSASSDFDTMESLEREIAVKQKTSFLYKGNGHKWRYSQDRVKDCLLLNDEEGAMEEEEQYQPNGGIISDFCSKLASLSPSKKFRNSEKFGFRSLSNS